MKAIIMTDVGGPEVLQLQEVDKPSIQNPTEVLVKLKAASINPIDIKLRSGAYPVNPMPTILGCDGAGVIEAIGTNVNNLSVDDEVYFFHGGLSGIPGNYAEYIVLDQRFVAKKPSSINFHEAAAAPLVLLTAWESLFDRTNVTQDSTVLIHAGAGGVGHVAIQLAKSVGAKVATTVSTQSKADFVSKLGADKIIFYKDENFVESILDWTNGEGVDVVMDNVGGALIEQSFAATKVYGDVVTLLLAPQETDWSVARIRNVRFSQEVMLTPLLLGIEQHQYHQTNIINKCTELFNEQKLKVEIQDVLPLEQAADAHRLIEQGSTSGKIVLSID